VVHPWLYPPNVLLLVLPLGLGDRVGPPPADGSGQWIRPGDPEYSQMHPSQAQGTASEASR
jgi:hypothetical protein